MVSWLVGVCGIRNKVFEKLIYIMRFEELLLGFGVLEKVLRGYEEFIGKV